MMIAPYDDNYHFALCMIFFSFFNALNFLNFSIFQIGDL